MENRHRRKGTFTVTLGATDKANQNDGPLILHGELFSLRM